MYKNGWYNIINVILWILAVASFFLCFYIYDKTSKMWVPFIGISAVFLICFYPAWALVRAKNILNSKLNIMSIKQQ